MHFIIIIKIIIKKTADVIIGLVSVLMQAELDEYEVVLATTPSTSNDDPCSFHFEIPNCILVMVHRVQAMFCVKINRELKLCSVLFLPTHECNGMGCLP